MNAYIDVRGPWPVYICGMVAIELRGIQRNVTVRGVEESLLVDGRLIDFAELPPAHYMTMQEFNNIWY